MCWSGSGPGVGLDSHYLGHRLSADVVPTVLDRLRLLPGKEQQYLLDALCAARPAPDGWSWNHSRPAAARRLNQMCPTNRPFMSIAGARSVVDRQSRRVW